MAAQVVERPQMRRKSSAQNLLSSFKAPPGNVPATPTVSTPIPKEFDTQSLFSDTTTLNNPQAPGGAQGTSVEYLRDLIQKRIITLTYIRNIHEGRSHWFHTIMITRAELDRVFNNTEMKKRTYRFATLGMSLSGLLDDTQPQDLLKGLISTLQEYEQGREDNDKPKIRPTKRLFKAKLASDAFLVAPHIPFNLDYHQTLLSLLDVLSEVYNKIAKLLGPSPFPHSSQNMMGPLGLLAPHPGVSYLFSSETGPYATPYHGQYSNPRLSSNPNLAGFEPEPGSLWSIANVSVEKHAHMSAQPTTTWNASLGEMVLKIDGKFKKITTVLLKELDQFARNGIKEELASLDPLLRNISLAEEGGRTIYEFDGM